MKRFTSLIIAMVIIFCCPTSVTGTTTNYVSVTVPSFKISVNDQSIDCRKLKYPLIEYKGITYFPLTWQWCRSLGLVSGYSEKDGLYIANYISEGQESLDTGGHQVVGTKYTASRVNYPIYINGKKLENAKKDYPFLNFRNITYFPLTYDFVVGEFGWNQSFSKTSGYKLYTAGTETNALPGSHYFDESCYTLQGFKDYAVMEKMTEERSISTTPDAYGFYSNNFVERTYKYYKLDYSNDNLTQIESEQTSDIPYDSGAVEGEDVSSHFTAEGSTLDYQNTRLIDLSTDAGAGNSIDTFYAEKYSVNGMEAYLLQVYFTNGDTKIPAPYTPCNHYVLIDKGDGILHQVKSWPSDQRLSSVYPYGTKGIYICSNGRTAGCARYNNARGWISIVNADLTETTLNGRWKSWNSLNAVGMDKNRNLYLLNTEFADFNNFTPSANSRGTVNPINDGYYRLDIDGKLTKIYPFVMGNQIYVTPLGEIYLDMGWMNGTLHLQTGKRICPDY